MGGGAIKKHYWYADGVEVAGTFLTRFARGSKLCL